MKLKEKIDEQKKLVFWQDQQSDKCLGRLTEEGRHKWPILGMKQWI